MNIIGGPHPRLLAHIPQIDKPIAGDYLRGEVVGGTLASVIVSRSQTNESRLMSENMLGIYKLCVSKLLSTNPGEDCL
jgi:hypothetical protein